MERVESLSRPPLAEGAPLRRGPAGTAPAASRAVEAWQMIAGLLEAMRVMPQRLRAADGSLPLTVISGFLGAGKTTLLNELLQAPGGRRLAVLVNDFGRINIDAELVRSRTEDMISLDNGCVCCTVSSELTRTLIDLAQRPEPPEAIVLEASGLADPRGIAQVALSNPALRLDGVLTLVDAQTMAEGPPTVAGDTIAHQLGAADLIVLTKTDLVDAAQQRAVRAALAARWPGRPIVVAEHGRVPADVVLGLHSHRDPCADGPRPWDHAAGFQSCSLQADAPLDLPSLRRFLDSLPAGLLRAKGVLHVAQDPLRRQVYQRVGRRGGLVADEPWGDRPPGSALVLIGPAGSLDAQGLQIAFRQLAAPAVPIPPDRRTGDPQVPGEPA